MYGAINNSDAFKPPEIAHHELANAAFPHLQHVES